eukprot:g1170.t1
MATYHINLLRLLNATNASVNSSDGGNTTTPQTGVDSFPYTQFLALSFALGIPFLISLAMIWELSVRTHGSFDYFSLEVFVYKKLGWIESMVKKTVSGEGPHRKTDFVIFWIGLLYLGLVTPFALVITHGFWFISSYPTFRLVGVGCLHVGLGISFFLIGLSMFCNSGYRMSLSCSVLLAMSALCLAFYGIVASSISTITFTGVSSVFLAFNMLAMVRLLFLLSSSKEEYGFDIDAWIAAVVKKKDVLAKVYKDLGFEKHQSYVDDILEIVEETEKQISDLQGGVAGNNKVAGAFDDGMKAKGGHDGNEPWKYASVEVLLSKAPLEEDQEQSHPEQQVSKAIFLEIGIVCLVYFLILVALSIAMNSSYLNYGWLGYITSIFVVIMDICFILCFGEDDRNKAANNIIWMSVYRGLIVCFGPQLYFVGHSAVILVFGVLVSYSIAKAMQKRASQTAKKKNIEKVLTRLETLKQTNNKGEEAEHFVYKRSESLLEMYENSGKRSTCMIIVLVLLVLLYIADCYVVYFVTKPPAIVVEIWSQIRIEQLPFGILCAGVLHIYALSRYLWIELSNLTAEWQEIVDKEDATKKKKLDEENKAKQKDKKTIITEDGNVVVLEAEEEKDNDNDTKKVEDIVPEISECTDVCLGFLNEFALDASEKEFWLGSKCHLLWAISFATVVSCVAYGFVFHFFTKGTFILLLSIFGPFIAASYTAFYRVWSHNQYNHSTVSITFYCLTFFLIGMLGLAHSLTETQTDVFPVMKYDYTTKSLKMYNRSTFISLSGIISVTIWAIVASASMTVTWVGLSILSLSVIAIFAIYQHIRRASVETFLKAMPALDFAMVEQANTISQRLKEEKISPLSIMNIFSLSRAKDGKVESDLEKQNTSEILQDYKAVEDTLSEDQNTRTAQSIHEFYNNEEKVNDVVEHLENVKHAWSLKTHRTAMLRIALESKGLQKIYAKRAIVAEMAQNGDINILLDVDESNEKLTEAIEKFIARKKAEAKEQIEYTRKLKKQMRKREFKDDENDKEKEEQRLLKEKLEKEKQRMEELEKQRREIERQRREEEKQKMEDTERRKREEERKKQLEEIRRQEQEEKEKRKRLEEEKKEMERKKREREEKERLEREKQKNNLEGDKNAKLGSFAYAQACFTEAVQSNDKFVDKEWPVEQRLGVKHEKRVSSWKRASTISRGEQGAQLYIDGPNVEDINQGASGTCYLLAAIGTLAEKRPDVIKGELIKRHDLKKGVFLFQFHGGMDPESNVSLNFQGNKECAFLMDDFVPMIQCSCGWACSCKEKCLAFCRPRGYCYVFEDDGSCHIPSSKTDIELWATMIEQAYAKVHGNYDAIWGGFQGKALCKLLGGRRRWKRVRSFVNADAFFADICSIFAKDGKDNVIIGVNTPSGNHHNLSPGGLSYGHAYSLLDAVEIDGHKLIKIKNPWGKRRGEWTGDWSDKDAKNWNRRLKSKLNFVDAGDGIFWMSHKDVHSYEVYWLPQRLRR